MHWLANRLGAILLASVALVGLVPQVTVVAQQADCHTFPETGMTVCGRFLQYWTEHGGLAQQGYPISPEFTETSDVNGHNYTVQYFERSVFEMHPENAAPNDVLLSLLGVSRYRQKYPGGASGQTPNTSAGTVLFSATGKRLGGEFLQYWNTHGGLAQQGYPISDELAERSDLDGKSYRVQYFERAVFEYHPENQPPNDVLLSQLGTFQYKDKYPSGQAPQGGSAPPNTGEKPVTLSGSGVMQTKPFSLAGGNYVSDWSASDPTGMGCMQSGFLESADPSFSVMFDVGTKILFPRSSDRGTAPLPGLQAGHYYLDMTSGCNWTVTISPQK
jgi:hypothetical protein